MGNFTPAEQKMMGHTSAVRHSSFGGTRPDGTGARWDNAVRALEE